MQTDFDVVIVGGGLVGASLALALAEQPLKIALIDANPADQVIHDSRAIALAFISKKIFTALNLWQTLAAFSCPIKAIHVSDQGHFGATHFYAHEHQVEAFGHVVQADKLLNVLQQAVTKKPAIQHFFSTQLNTFSYVSDHELKLELATQNNHLQINTKLLVAADGTQSWVRQLANVKTHITDYQQNALIANVKLAKSHQFTAYERFTSQGPLALLPFAEKLSTLIWTLPHDKIEVVKTLKKFELLTQLQTAFGYRLGRFSDIQLQQVYPLKLWQAQEIIRPSIVLVGNAAQTLHPIAAQGFNLGLRDVACLAQTITEAIKANKSPGDIEELKKYEFWRQTDKDQTIKFTDNLVRLFSTTQYPLATIRDLGLFTLDYLTPAKNYFVQKNMGFAYKMPRLACGLTL